MISVKKRKLFVYSYSAISEKPEAKQGFNNFKKSQMVPGAGIERARFYWAHDSVGVILA